MPATRFRPRVYLASPLGFSAHQRKHVLPLFIDALTRAGCDVYEPFTQNEQDGLGPASGNANWAFAIARADARAVVDCDAVFAVVNGVPPDEGVCVELGVAIATGTPYFLFRDDFRHAGDSGSFPCNLMLLAGLPVDSWQEYVYTDLAEVGTSTKALAKWVQRWQHSRPVPRQLRRRTPAGLPRRRLTLVFCLRSSGSSRPTHVLLGMKKRGFGAGKFNGFGGKVEKDGETILQGAVRELREEAGLVVASRDMIRRGMIEFEMLPKGNEQDATGMLVPGTANVLEVHVFTTTKWGGEPSESEEMRPQWFACEDVPLGSMWKDDRHWLPALLQQPARPSEDKNAPVLPCFRAFFRFAPDQATILAMRMDWQVDPGSLPNPTRATAEK